MAKKKMELTGIDSNRLLGKVLKGINKSIKQNTGRTNENTDAKKKNLTVTQKQAQEIKKQAQGIKALTEQVQTLTDKIKKGNTRTRNLQGTFSVLRSKLLLASFAMRGFQQTVGTLITAHADHQAALGRLELGLKNAGGQLDKGVLGLSDYAKKLQDSTGISDTLIVNQMALLATFQEVKGELEDGSQVFDVATEAILDYTAASNQGKITQDGLRSATIQVGKALNDPIKGYTALQRNGVVFSKTQVKLIKQFSESGEKAKAQQIILDELNKEFGKTASIDSYEKSLRQLDSAFGDVQKEMGEKLLPAMEAVVKVLSHLAVSMDPMKVLKWSGAIIAAEMTIRAYTHITILATTATVSFGTALFTLAKRFAALAVLAKTFEQLAILFGFFEDGVDEAQKLERQMKLLEEQAKIMIKPFLSMSDAMKELEIEKVGARMKELTDNMDALNNQSATLTTGQQALMETWHDEWALLHTLMLLMLELRGVQTGLGEGPDLSWIDKLKANLPEAANITSKFASSIKGVVSAMEANAQAALDEDLTSRKASANKIKNAARRERELARIESLAISKKKALAARMKPLKLAEATIDMGAAIMGALALKPWNPLVNIPLAAMMAAKGAIQLATISGTDVGFAKGGSFETTGPQMIMVGDNPGGKERVDITPLSSPNIAGPQASSSVIVNVSGNVMSQDFVEGELADSIKKAIRRGSDFGIS